MSKYISVDKLKEMIKKNSSKPYVGHTIITIEVEDLLEFIDENSEELEIEDEKVYCGDCKYRDRLNYCIASIDNENYHCTKFKQRK